MPEGEHKNHSHFGPHYNSPRPAAALSTTEETLAVSNTWFRVQGSCLHLQTFPETSADFSQNPLCLQPGGQQPQEPSPTSSWDGPQERPTLDPVPVPHIHPHPREMLRPSHGGSCCRHQHSGGSFRGSQAMSSDLLLTGDLGPSPLLWWHETQGVREHLATASLFLGAGD